MKFRSTFLKPKWVVLILVIMIPAIVNQLLLDKPSYKLIGTDVKNVLEISCIVVLAVVGNFGVKDFTNKWPLNIWRLIYFASVLFLILMALIQAFVYQYTINNQYRFTSIKIMLFSPMFYLLLLILDGMKLKKAD
ncbi:MAG: hypothetical protein H7101_08375 [Deinococcales bacterium]|nr:hypothetical protein [Chitinophagaceae bacterium]